MTAPVMEKARKGDLVAYRVQRSYVSQVDHKRHESHTWHIGLVESARRDGRVRVIRQASYGTTLDVEKSPHVSSLHVSPDGRVDARAAFAAASADPLGFDSLDDLRDFVLPFKA